MFGLFVAIILVSVLNETGSIKTKTQVSGFVTKQITEHWALLATFPQVSTVVVVGSPYGSSSIAPSAITDAQRFTTVSLVHSPRTLDQIS